jgi:hypothetical protein
MESANSRLASVSFLDTLAEIACRDIPVVETSDGVRSPQQIRYQVRKLDLVILSHAFIAPKSDV